MSCMQYHEFNAMYASRDMKIYVLHQILPLGVERFSLMHGGIFLRVEKYLVTVRVSDFDIGIFPTHIKLSFTLYH